jgi:hypothetical protein
MATFCLNSRTARPGFDGVLFQTGSFAKSASKRRPFPTAAEANDHGIRSATSATFRLIQPSLLEPFLWAVMYGPLSFKAALRNCCACSHASPVIVLERDGVKCKCVENGSIIAMSSPTECGDQGTRDKHAAQKNDQKERRVAEAALTSKKVRARIHCACRRYTTQLSLVPPF